MLCSNVLSKYKISLKYNKSLFVCLTQIIDATTTQVKQWKWENFTLFLEGKERKRKIELGSNEKGLSK